MGLRPCKWQHRPWTKCGTFCRTFFFFFLQFPRWNRLQFLSAPTSPNTRFRIFYPDDFSFTTFPPTAVFPRAFSAAAFARRFGAAAGVPGQKSNFPPRDTPPAHATQRTLRARIDFCGPRTRRRPRTDIGRRPPAPHTCTHKSANPRNAARGVRFGVGLDTRGRRFRKEKPRRAGAVFSGWKNSTLQQLGYSVVSETIRRVPSCPW